MARTLFLLLAFISTLHSSLLAQQDDPVLFTIDGNPVHVSEFTYIYSKTNGENADFSQASLQEYLDLYTRFKLKVQKAKDMRLDTIQSLQQELDGYRRQLADSYLINKEITEKLTREAWERSQEDVDISQIIISLEPNPNERAYKAAYDRIMKLKARIDAGEDFGTVAAEGSDEKSAKDTRGRIGYVTALFPNGYYPLETAAYGLQPGQVSAPVQTDIGLHLIKVHDRRPARGEMEGGHILIRQAVGKRSPDAAKALVDSLYQALENGANFEELARNFSEDKQTATKGGYIGFFGINRFEKAFEDAAFALTEDGSYTQPIRSSVGYHIIKRISSQKVDTYEKARARMEALVKRDARYQKAQDALIETIKKDGDFQEFPLVLGRFAASQNDTLFTFRWKKPLRRSKEVLFTLGDTKKTVADFTDYLVQATRVRMRMGREKPVQEGVQELYEQFVEESSMRYAERNLIEKYPEFKALMREYEEGILLFEVTKMKVWDKAAQDSSGLSNFYQTLGDKYSWNTRAVATHYTLQSRAQSLVTPVREYAKENGPQEVNNKFSTDMLTYKRVVLEKDKSPEAKALKDWEAGELSITKLDRKNETYSFYKVEEILPAGPKKLSEARGYVIADYQDKLEKEWVEELEKEYKVKINQEVFEDLIKK